MGERKACHNCRKRRLRCDRSVPACLKCTRAGRTCQGYGKLYRWVDPTSTDGPQTPSGRGITVLSPTRSDSLLRQQDFHQKGRYGSDRQAKDGEQDTGLVKPLADPLVQDLSKSSRYYIFYFTSRFCQDLVVHDSAELGINPFRELIPMSHAYSYLQHIVVAVSACHYHHAVKHSLSPSTEPYCGAARLSLIDALRSRQEAIKELLAILSRPRSAFSEATDQHEQDALLATVLMFVNFTLIDSGKDGWRSHLSAAGRLLSAHCLSPKSLLLGGAEDDSPVSYPSTAGPESALTPMLAEMIPNSISFTPDLTASRPLSACDYVASDTVAYFIWNCALESLIPASYSSPTPSSQPSPSSSSSPTTPFSASPSSTSSPFQVASPDFAVQPADWDIGKVMKILQRTEANSYHSCPAHLMGIVLRVARLTHARKAARSGSPSRSGGDSRYYANDATDTYIALLKEAEDFDIETWASTISTHHALAHGTLGSAIAEQEMSLRLHIAATYRAAVCLYILLVAPELPKEIAKRQQQRKYQFQLQQHQQRQRSQSPITPALVSATTATSPMSNSALSSSSYSSTPTFDIMTNPDSSPAREEETEQESLPFLPTTEDLATTILQQLSFVPKTSPFFKFTTWPVFLTGVHASTAPRRAWVTDRLSQMRDLCPWGMLTSAMETLMEIWALRDGGNSINDRGAVGSEAPTDLLGGGGAMEGEEGSCSDWLARLEGLEIDCLIV